MCVSRELVERSQRRLQEAKDQLEAATAELEEAQELLDDLIRSERSARSSCKPDVARSFLQLFPRTRCVFSSSLWGLSGWL